MERFEELIPLILEAIPKAVQALEIAEPICCVRVHYIDAHAPSMYLHLRIITQAHRERILAEKGRDALSILWASCEACGDAGVIIPDDLNSKNIQENIRHLFEGAYTLIGRDEKGVVVALQWVLRRVCQQLNQQDWSKICLVTDDFVIAPADGSQFFGGNAEYDDLAKSIPAERLAVLRSRGLLGPGQYWDERPGFQYERGVPIAVRLAMEEIEARASAMPIFERIAYWIDQLTRMANGEDCDVRAINLSEGYPVEKLGQIGDAGVVAALTLASRLIEMDSNVAYSIVYFTVKLVRETKVTTEPIESLLQEILRKRDPDYGGVPTLCASTLHDLFPGYPEVRSGVNARGDLIFPNYDQFLERPKPKQPWWRIW